MALIRSASILTVIVWSICSRPIVIHALRECRSNSGATTIPCTLPFAVPQDPGAASNS